MKILSTVLLALALAPGLAAAEDKKVGGDFPDLSSVLNDLPPPNKPDAKAPPKAAPKQQPLPDMKPVARPDPEEKPAVVPAIETQPAAAHAPAPTPAKPGLDVSRMLWDPESIRQVVKFHMPEIQECYEKVLADTGKKLQGRIVVGFIVEPTGLVREARVLPKKSTLKDDRISDCVLDIRRWQFPKPGDDRIYPMEYPFDLKILK